MIGIIGGNGVAATNKLMCLVEEQLTKEGAYRDCHHPEMVIWQATKAPSRSMYLEKRGPSWIEDYINIGTSLKNCGCTELCMCCNTAYYAVDELSRKIGIKFVNLLDLVAIQCNNIGSRKIGMMCSDGLRGIGLYEKRFSIYASDVEFIYPDDDIQKIITLGICNAKSKIRFADPSKEEQHPYNCFSLVCKHLIEDQHVDTIVAGCTDICNVFTLKSKNVKYVDSLCVLSEYICEHHKMNAK